MTLTPSPREGAGGSRDHFRVARELARDPKDKSRPFTARQVPMAMETEKAIQRLELLIN